MSAAIRSSVLAWARVAGRSWQRVGGTKQEIPPAPPSVLVLSGLGAGRWDAAVWDTWTGGVRDRQEVMVPATGEARVPLPALEKDATVRLRRR